MTGGGVRAEVAGSAGTSSECGSRMRKARIGTGMFLRLWLPRSSIVAEPSAPPPELEPSSSEEPAPASEEPTLVVEFNPAYPNVVVLPATLQMFAPTHLETA